MDPRIEFQNLLRSDAPILALAPMQDVTDLRFMRLISGYGNADLYFTEYFRVLPDSRLDPQILASITQNPTVCGRLQRENYSVRSAAIGLMRVARRAGNQVAIRVATPSNRGAVRKAIGSSAPT